jgi:sec-independent protein translocase protein TatB
VFNVGGGELLVIMLVALIVLGPQRLPDAARQIGKFMGELRRMSTGFQQELKDAMDHPLEAAARERGAKHTAPTPPPAPGADPPGAPSAPAPEAATPDTSQGDVGHRPTAGQPDEPAAP